MIDISEPGAFGLAGEAERLVVITHAQVDLVLKEAEIAEDEARLSDASRRIKRVGRVSVSTPRSEVRMFQMGSCLRQRVLL
jgi:hypothetical protein